MSRAHGAPTLDRDDGPADLSCRDEPCCCRSIRSRHVCPTGAGQASWKRRCRSRACRRAPGSHQASAHRLDRGLQRSCTVGSDSAGRWNLFRRRAPALAFAEARWGSLARHRPRTGAARRLSDPLTGRTRGASKSGELVRAGPCAGHVGSADVRRPRRRGALVGPDVSAGEAHRDQAMAAPVVRPARPATPSTVRRRVQPARAHRSTRPARHVRHRVPHGVSRALAVSRGDCRAVTGTGRTPGADSSQLKRGSGARPRRNRRRGRGRRDRKRGRIASCELHRLLDPGRHARTSSPDPVAREPSLPPSKIREVAFLIDGKRSWVEHHAPYSYAHDGNYFVTSWIRPAYVHSGGGRDRRTTRATSSSRVRTSASTPPPSLLAGSWHRRISAADAGNAGRGEIWTLAVTPVGWRILDPTQGWDALITCHRSLSATAGASPAIG